MNSRSEVIDLTLDEDEFVTPPSTSHHRRSEDFRAAQRSASNSWNDFTGSKRAFNERFTNLELKGFPNGSGARPASRHQRLTQIHESNHVQISNQKSAHLSSKSRSPTMPHSIAARSPLPEALPRSKDKAEKHRKACTFCIAQGEAASCDGGHPCSACVEPNPDGCEYADDVPQHLHQSSFAHRDGHSQRPPRGRLQSNHHMDGSSEQSTLPARPPVPRNISWMLSLDSPPVHDSIEHIPMASDTSQNATSHTTFAETEEPPPPPPVDFEEVKALLKQHEDKMRAHREYVLRPKLLEARLQCQKTAVPHLGTESNPNPFAILLQRRNALHNGDSVAFQDVDKYVIKTHRGNGSKRFVTKTIPIQRYKAQDDTPILPKYRSIGRLGQSFLTRNVHTLKYEPYFADDEQYDSSQDEKDDELKQRYKSNDAELIKQRKCRELVFLWRPWLLDFVREMNLSYVDILYYLVTDDRLKCKMCDTKPIRGGRRQAARLKGMLNSPGSDVLQHAKWASDALLEIVGIGIWHVLDDMSEIRNVLRQSYSAETRTPLTTMCSICFLTDCQTHGAYFDVDDDSEKEVMIDDSETENNVKQPAKTSPADKAGKHQCGFYCLAVPGTNYLPTTFWGLRPDGKINGLKNPDPQTGGEAMFAKDKICGEYCFWEVERRRQYHQDHPSVKGANISATQRDTLHTLIRLYARNERAPCMIARWAKVPCMSVFYEMLTVMNAIPHRSTDAVNDEDQDETLSDHGTRKVSKAAAGFDTSNSRKLDARQPFVPCSHEGPCLDCSCAHDNVHCEYFCGCDESCKRRFQGCRCRGRVCFNDDRCECWANNRECDPWLCGNCGVTEVLDPNNKYRDDIRQGRCQNNRIQLDLPARTIKAPSEVQGWGLYAGEDMEANTFIGEYKGEVISVKEGDRRGVVYHNIGQEYLFITNADQQIDGSRFGNKTRFMNNSNRDQNINVLAKNLFSNGVQKVMFYTKKPVKAGEELLYDYNYPDHVVKNFWERGENPVDSHGVATSMVKPRITGRFLKSVAGKNDGEEGSAGKQEQMTMRREKKKRRRGQYDGTADSLSNDAEQVVQDADFFHSMATVGRSDHHASNESDYDESEGEYEEQSDLQEVSDDEDGEDEDAGFRTEPRRRRQIQAIDRRRGGLAQKRAWETRRRNGRG